MATDIVGNTEPSTRTIVFEGRQRIFEAQGIARMLKLHFVGASAQPGVLCCCDAIDYLLQDSLNRLEELE